MAHSARIRHAIILEALLFGLLILADQLVKIAVERAIPLGQIKTFIPELVDLTYIQNPGAAFSILADSTLLLLGVRLVLTAFVAFWLIYRHNRLSLALRLCLICILAGAVGNLIDQLLFGYVRDMFSFAFMNFAIFNMADIYITCSVVVLALLILFSDTESESLPF